jgi:hypothetical protein
MNREVLRSALSMLVNPRRLASTPLSPAARVLATARATAERRLAELSGDDRARLARRLGIDPQNPNAAPSLRDSDPP